MSNIFRLTDDQRGRLTGRTMGGLNTKLHAVTDAKGRPIRFFMTAGEVSDCTGAAATLSSLSASDWLIADLGYDADRFRDALRDKGIHPCIPVRKFRGKAVRYEKLAPRGETGSRSCWADLRTGTGSPPAKTGAQRPSSPP